jgi:hypothetical protein
MQGKKGADVEADAGTRTPDPFITSRPRGFRLIAADAADRLVVGFGRARPRSWFVAGGGWCVAHSVARLASRDVRPGVSFRCPRNAKARSAWDSFSIFLQWEMATLLSPVARARSAWLIPLSSRRILQPDQAGVAGRLCSDNTAHAERPRSAERGSDRVLRSLPGPPTGGPTRRIPRDAGHRRRTSRPPAIRPLALGSRSAPGRSLSGESSEDVARHRVSQEARLQRDELPHPPLRSPVEPTAAESLGRGRIRIVQPSHPGSAPPQPAVLVARSPPLSAQPAGGAAARA